LKPEGYFAFTVEEEEGASFSIYPNTMRFKHSKRYCDALASEHGYDVLGVSTARIRQNLGSDVMGLYYVLQKNAP
jgi:predicted TPR repeat methyltransferase